MTNLKLIFPSEEYEEAWVDVLQEMEAETNDITPHALRHNAKNYHEYLEIVRKYASGIDLPPGRVRSELFFLTEGENRRIIGAVDIRYELNDYLFRIGGNIGYGIRPTERRKGYATKMLKMALDVARKSGLKKVLVSCDQDNVASRRTIEKNGGVLENVVPYEGEDVMRFWIPLESPKKG